MNDPKIIELIRQASGPKPELALPEMQRRYVWRSTQVRDLFDSLYRGYLIGSFLIWERPFADTEGRTLDVGPIAGEVNVCARKLLLDGQQRLTSLKSIINDEVLHTKDGRTRSIDILFNVNHPDEIPDGNFDDDDSAESTDDDSIGEVLENKTFVVATKRLQNKSNWISLRELYRMEQIAAWRKVVKAMAIDMESPESDKISGRLSKLYNIPERTASVVWLPSNLQYRTVTEIFCRVNSLGTRLRGSDLALAQITSRWEKSMPMFEEFCESHKCKEQQLFDLGMVVRALVVFVTGQCKFQTISSVSIEEFKKGWKETKEALETAISIAFGWGISTFSLLSAPALIITLAYYIKRRPNESGNLSQLHKWLLLASIYGHYSKGSSETMMDQDLAAIDRGDSVEQLIQALSKQGWHGRIEEDELQGKLHGSPYFGLMYLAMRAAGAKDWNYDSIIDLSSVGSTLKLEFHHIFPKARLKGTPYVDREKNDISNLAFIGGKTNNRISDRLPTEYLPEIGDEKLKAQCVPLDRSLYHIAKYREFLAERRRLIADMLNEYIDKL